MNYYVYISFRISKNAYSSLIFELEGICQGNSISRIIYRDKLYSIFKMLKMQIKE